MSAWRSRRRRREAGSEEGHCHCIIAACRGGLPCGRAKVCRGDERSAGERFCGDERSADEEGGVRAAAPAVRGNHVVGWPLPPPRSSRIHILPPARGHNAPPPGAGAVGAVWLRGSFRGSLSREAASRVAALDFCAAVLLYYMRQRASVRRCAVVRELSGNGKRQDL